MDVTVVSPATVPGDVFDVFLDSIFATRLQLVSGTRLYPLFSLWPASRLVQVIKATEPAWNAGNATLRAPVVNGFWTTGSMQAPPPPTGTTVGLRSEVYPVAPPPYGGPRRLLFIGDSLTAG
ncbi:unnamed protein product, partial [Symbiodinium sp. KB8]